MFSISDVKIFKEALVAAADGPFFPDWEFSTLFGVERDEFRSIASAFSEATPITGSTSSAINNACNNLLGYPHGEERVWSQWLSVGPAELQVSYSRLRARRHVA